MDALEGREDHGNEDVVLRKDDEHCRAKIRPVGSYLSSL